MALQYDIATAAITLPLDIVLNLLKVSKGSLEEKMDIEDVGLLKIEVASVLSHIMGLEEEVMKGIMRDTFGSL